MKKLLTITTAAAGLAVLMAGPAMADPLDTTFSVTTTWFSRRTPRRPSSCAA